MSQNVKLAGQFTVIFWWCDLADGRFLVPEPEYSVQGHASATLQCHLVKGDAGI